MKRIRRQPAYKWWGCWSLEKRSAIASCEALIVYSQPGRDEFWGTVCGEGGAVYEEFYLKLCGDEVARLVLDETDRGTSEHVDWVKVARHNRDAFFPGYDVICEFNSAGGWARDVLVLVPDAIESKNLRIVAVERGSQYHELVGGTGSAVWIPLVLGEARLRVPMLRNLRRHDPRKTVAKAARRAAEAWIPKIRKKMRQLELEWEKQDGE